MIIIGLKGGLGNQLFQYSFGRFLMIKNNEKVKFEFCTPDRNDTQREYKLDNFNTKIEIASPEEIKSVKRQGVFSQFIKKVRNKISKQYNIGYNPAFEKTKEKYLEGFWQSHKYLEPIQNVLFREITLKKPIEDKYKELLNKIVNSNSISIHIRRGDYVNDLKTKVTHYAFGLEYYEKAIKTIDSKIQDPSFFIFSDDIMWVKDNLEINFPTIFVSSPDIKDFEELALMSKCKHNIIANSSFSFWGAWLNQNPNKIVIAPEKWNNIYQEEYKDLLPEEWIKI